MLCTKLVLFTGLYKGAWSAKQNYGEVGKYINMENLPSETIVWHFISIFGFC